MRRGEILSLRRKSIDWQNQQATIAQTKNGEAGHNAPRCTALAALKSLPVRLDGGLFPFKDDARGVTCVQTSVRARRDRSLPPFTICDILLLAPYAAGGANQRSLQALLRHRGDADGHALQPSDRRHLRVAVDAVNLGAARPEPAVKADAS